MRTILYVLVLVVLIGCKKKKVSEEGSAEIIDLSGSIKNEVSMNLSDIASNIAYIPLESSENSWISEVSHIQVTPKHIYILDIKQNLLFQFNLNGNFQRKIGVQGRGPKEYSKIYDFHVISSSTGETICTSDGNTENIFFYDENGEFLSSFKPITFVSDLAFLDNDNLILHSNVMWSSYYNEDYSLNITDKKGQVLSQFKTNEVTFNKQFPAPVNGALRKFQNKIQYFEPYERSLFEISNSGNILKKYAFDLGDTSVALEDIVKIDESNKASDLHGIIESENFIFAKFHYNNYLICAFYSKKENKAVDVIFNLDLVDHGFHNDLDGGMPFWPSSSTDNGKWISYFYPIRAREVLNDPYYNTFQIKNPDEREKLLQMINVSHDFDNPIIQITTPKAI